MKRLVWAFAGVGLLTLSGCGGDPSGSAPQPVITVRATVTASASGDDGVPRTFHQVCRYLLVTLPPYESSTGVDASADELNAYANQLDGLQDTEDDDAMGVTAAVEGDVQALAEALGTAGEHAAVLVLDETVREVRGTCGGFYNDGQRLTMTGS